VFFHEYLDLANCNKRIDKIFIVRKRLFKKLPEKNSGKISAYNALPVRF